MPFVLNHVLGSGRLTPVKRQDGAASYFHVSGTGTLVNPHPGVVKKSLVAQFRYRIHTGDVTHGGATHGGFETTTEGILAALRIFTPDGQEFTRPEIAMQDLYRFRDLRGIPVGNWTWTVTGDGRHIKLNQHGVVGERIFDPFCFFSVAVEEHVHSESSGPLIADAPVTASSHRFSFDLFRVGTFVATISHDPLLHLWRGTMRLVDPDGNAVAVTWRDTLSVPIDLRLLDRSRDAAGHPRTWTLELLQQGGVVVGPLRLNATVIASARTTVAAIQSRINKLFGPHGSFIQLYGENKDGLVAARFVDTDVVSAETLDMHDILQKQLKKYNQIPPAVNDEVDANIVYTLADHSEILGNAITVKAGSMKVESIDATVGPGIRLGAAVPAARLVVKISGEVEFEFAGVTIGSASIKDGTLEVEIGVQLSADGTPTMATWFPDEPFDIDLSWTVILGLPPLVVIGAEVVKEIVADYINDNVVAGARDLFTDPTMAPRFLMMMLGGHFSYRAIRTEGQDFVFDYVAPTEPDPHQSPAYHGVIGRSYQQLSEIAILFNPKTLGDTWKHSNLSHIKHIVVVMMENRSYDHVLGYRARPPFNDGADGLTDEMIAEIEATAPANAGPQSPMPFYDVRNLRDACFPKDVAQLMTRLPKGVPHTFEDVAQQLGGGKIPGPGNRTINSPAGFYDNFSKRVSDNDPTGVKAIDVLGYYDDHELSFYAYLAEHYAYCDRYFCSHPGPTLPNRMFSLSGDLQHSRIGVPLMNNSDGDEFLLSRALTIYDFMSRKGIGWRVYESDPSLTMLRMYARYATDTVNIRSISWLQRDVAAGDLPAYVAIEPAMHHHPENDDHPDADMLRGQQFLQSVYKTLRSNQTLWSETLLIITYDEHGGLYDHVVPPDADLLATSAGLLTSPLVVGEGSSNPVSSPATIAVPYGVRVPTFVVSPWVQPGKGPSITLDHCSILKTVLARFLGDQKPFFGDRVNASQTFESFLTAPSPRMDVPAPAPLPDLPLDVRRIVDPGQTDIDTPILTRKDMREKPTDYHVLTGRLARMLGR